MKLRTRIYVGEHQTTSSHSSIGLKSLAGTSLRCSRFSRTFHIRGARRFESLRRSSNVAGVPSDHWGRRQRLPGVRPIGYWSRFRYARPREPDALASRPPRVYRILTTRLDSLEEICRKWVLRQYPDELTDPPVAAAPEGRSEARITSTSTSTVGLVFYEAATPLVAVH
jgi:hypothetical protein